MSVTTTCTRCQTSLEPGAKFCQVCGLNVSGELTAPLPTLLQVLRQATLGEYEVVREIGVGGMATVFLAHEIALDRKVAIKVMSPNLVQGAEMIERFKREARTAAALTHPHIVPIYSVRETEHLLFFVMKYIKGRGLDAILKDSGPLPFPMVRTILADVGSALDYAHRQGVVHRDVKPGNIMIDEEGFAFITDFGIAKATESGSLTRSGTTVGTPSYLSPEACSGDSVGPAADQYSLGIVGYEMITGQLPFSAESSLGMMYAQVHNVPRPSEQLRPECPDDLRDAIMRMLEKSPLDRFPIMKEAVQAVAGGRSSATQLEVDDHVRSHVGLLAVPRPSRGDTDPRLTPASPIAIRVPSSPSRRAARRRRVVWRRVFGGIGLVALGALANFVIGRVRSAQNPSPPDSVEQASAIATPADSLWLVAKGAADMARQQAVAASATPAAIAAGDTLQAKADSMAQSGRKAEAALLLQQAASLWATARPVTTSEASRPAAVTPPRPSSSASPPPGSTEPARAEPAVLSDSAQIVQYYDSLAQAFGSKQVGEIRRLMPNLPEKEEKNWRELFRERDLEYVNASFIVRNIERNGEEATARVYVEIILTWKGGRIEKRRDRLEVTRLTFGPTGWRQIFSDPEHR